jgi:hypothetical protein
MFKSPSRRLVSEFSRKRQGLESDSWKLFWWRIVARIVCKCATSSPALVTGLPFCIQFGVIAHWLVWSCMLPAYISGSFENSCIDNFLSFGIQDGFNDLLFSPLKKLRFQKGLQRFWNSMFQIRCKSDSRYISSLQLAQCRHFQNLLSPSSWIVKY